MYKLDGWEHSFLSKNGLLGTFLKPVTFFFFWFKDLYSFQVRKNPNVITILNLRDVCIFKTEEAKRLLTIKGRREEERDGEREKKLNYRKI